MDIHPTTTCFDDAVEFFDQIIVNREALDQCHLLIVHSICVMPDGTPYAHAWVEDPKTNNCIFKAIIKGKAAYYAADQKGFYEQYKVQVQDTTKYTLKQACLENLRTGMYGPWKEKYRLLTKQGKLTQNLQC